MVGSPPKVVRFPRIAVFGLIFVTFSGVLVVHQDWAPTTRVTDTRLADRDRGASETFAAREGANSERPRTAVLAPTPSAAVRKPRVAVAAPTPVPTRSERTTATAVVTTPHASILEATSTSDADPTNPFTKTTAATAVPTWRTGGSTEPVSLETTSTTVVPATIAPSPSNASSESRAQRVSKLLGVAEEASHIFVEPPRDENVTIESPAPASGHRMWVEIAPLPPTEAGERERPALEAHVSTQFGKIIAAMATDIFEGRDPFSNSSTPSTRPTYNKQSVYFSPPGAGTVVVSRGSSVRDSAIQTHVGATEVLDAVVTHVDNHAPGWALRMQSFMKAGQPQDDARFRDLGELQYCLSGIIGHGGSLVRNVHVIVADETHIPQWLQQLRARDPDLHERIRIVPHSLLFPSDCPKVNATSNAETDQSCYLPTFSSCAIETTLHRIPDLSPYFIYFNNDMFFGRKLSLYDYFRPVLAGSPVTPAEVGHDREFSVSLDPVALKQSLKAASNGAAAIVNGFDWLGLRVADAENAGQHSGIAVTVVSGRALGVPGGDAARRLFVEFEPLVFSERKDFPNGCSPYHADHGMGDGTFACREKNPKYNFARDARRGRHGRCPQHLANVTRRPDVPLFRGVQRNSKTLMMPGPCHFANVDDYDFASALYVALWKRMKILETMDAVVVNNASSWDAAVNGAVAEAVLEVQRVKGGGSTLRPRSMLRVGRLRPVMSIPKDDRYDFNVFYTVNKRRGWDYFGVFPSHTFAHAPRVMDKGAFEDMITLLAPLVSVTRRHRFRESTDLFIPYLWELYAIVDRRARRAKSLPNLRVGPEREDVLQLHPSARARSSGVTICSKNVSSARHFVPALVTVPLDVAKWRLHCVDVDNDMTDQLRPVAEALPLQIVQASVNVPSRIPTHIRGVSWTQGSTTYATERLLSDFMVLNLKPMYYFAMVGNRFEVKRYRAELAKQVTAFITVNDNFRKVDAMVLSVIQDLFKVIIADAALLE